MKTPIYLICLLFGFICAKAQVTEGLREMSLGVQNGLSLELPEVAPDYADDLWKTYIKKYGGKYKWNRKAKEHLSEGVNIPNISGGDPMNIFASASKNGNNTVFTLWFEIKGQFLRKERMADKYDAAENLLNHFALEVAKEKMKDNIKAEEKSLSKLQSDQKRLERARTGYEKDIEDAKEKIRKSEESLITNAKDQEEARQAIRRQEELLEQLKRKLAEL